MFISILFKNYLGSMIQIKEVVVKTRGILSQTVAYSISETINLSRYTQIKIFLMFTRKQANHSFTTVSC